MTRVASVPPFELLDDPAELALSQGWSESQYRDLLAVQAGEMSHADFDRKYLVEKAILVLDLTGFTENTLRGGALPSFLRILDAQKLCIPVLREHESEHVHTLADDIVATFADPNRALDAALEIQRRSAVMQQHDGEHANRAECCIGLGCGPVYAIGPNHVMGDEMNRASKLGEDTARGGEILVTELVRNAVVHRADLKLEGQTSDDLLFPYFRVKPVE